ncbi:MAG TPA: c-type cytochrome biogenesis protein CcmI [Rhodospirillaceae bacterium]|nr:c-type cytochrome biogenesis protein CcmI [Rhodospirillaceae bacterium]
MAFWVTVMVLMGIGLGAVLWPLTRRPTESTNAAEYDQEVYKAQLAELDRDLADGRISKAEARASRTEIARRLLAADRVADATTETQAPPGAAYKIIIATVILIPAIALGFYGFRGQPELSGQPFAERQQAKQNAGADGSANADVMIQRLAQQLAENPDNAEGWALLARSYLTLGRYQKAVPAFEKALGLDSGNTNLRSAYGETLFFAAGNVVTPAARAAFQAVLEMEPKEPRARYYLALADSAAGKEKKALADLRNLIAETPASAAYLPILIAQANKIAEKIGAPPIVPPQNAGKDTSPSPGPTEEDMRAAAQMSAEDRKQMIQSMVQRLADRLKETPNDLNGWIRLANAYRVLGQTDKQTEVLKKASKLAPKNIDILLLYGRALRTAAKNRQTPESVAIMRRVLALEPNNLEALFLVGRAEAAAGRIDEGKALMSKALDLLPPGAKERGDLQKEIDALGK